MDTEFIKKIEEAAWAMAVDLGSDSGIPTKRSFPLIYSALMKDERIPSLYEQECLTLGGPVSAEIDAEHPDTDGEGNEEVDARFPHTNLAISEVFNRSISEMF